MTTIARRSAAEELLRSRFVSGVFVALIARFRSAGSNRPEERARIEEGLVDLSRLFYYAEGHGRGVGLGEELRFAELYLRLQALRYEGRLAYSVSGEPELARRRVPRLSTLASLERASAELLELSSGPAFIRVAAKRRLIGGVELRVEGTRGRFPALEDRALPHAPTHRRKAVRRLLRY